MTVTTTGHVRLKTVAIPPEHGAWGFLLEPIILGLGVTPSLAGVYVALAVLGGFLMRHPLKIALMDRQRGKRSARTVLAERFALGYGLLVVGGGIAAVVLAGFVFIVPFLLAAPLGIVVFTSAARSRSREVLPELAGALTLAATGPGIALAGGEPGSLALAVWVILAARNVPSILYVRARLRLERDKPYSLALVLLANVIAVLVLAGFAAAGTVPWLAVIALIVLLARAAWGLSPYRRSVRVQTIGFLEMGYGLLTVLLAVIGYAA